MPHQPLYPPDPENRKLELAWVFWRREKSAVPASSHSIITTLIMQWHLLSKIREKIKRAKIKFRRSKGIHVQAVSGLHNMQLT
jgi:hypothetical protein